MKLKVLIVLLGLGFSLLASAAEPIKSINPQNDIPKYGKDSATCVQNLSLYREFYKQWKQSKYTNAAITDAAKWWSWVFKNCPRASENIYVDGVKMLKYRIKKADNADDKEKLIDTLLMIYDQRIKYFPLHYKTRKPQEGAILGRKGVSLYEFRPQEYKQVNEILKRSIDLDKENASGPAFVYYFRTLTKMASKGEADTLAVVEAYDMLSDYLETNLNKYKEAGNDKKVEHYQNIIGTIEKNFEPFAQCHDLVRIYQQKFDKTPDDIDLLKKIVKILDKKKCVEEPLYFNAVVNLYKLEPSPEAAYMIGKMMLNQKRYNDAIPYMEDATKMENTDKVDDALIFLAQAYRALGNYPMARKKALEATKLNPHWGKPYAFIGDLYVLSVNECGSNDLEKKAPYWAAVDMYKKAKTVDPEMAKEMNELIRRYSPYFPPAEVLFFYNLQEGDEYQIGCWINVKTKVRAAK
jgi:tetratricopeptide (TPR) repeat protein